MEHKGTKRLETKHQFNFVFSLFSCSSIKMNVLLIIFFN